MTSSAALARQQLQEQVGEVGRAGVRWVPGQGLVHKVTCTICDDYGGRTYRQGKPNRFVDALSRWTLHLHYAHPEADAPCLSRLGEIKAVRKAQRERERQEATEIASVLSDRAERRKAQIVARFEAASFAENVVKP